MRPAYRFKTRQAGQSRNILRTLHVQASMPGFRLRQWPDQRGKH